MMKEYRFVGLPPLESFWQSLSSVELKLIPVRLRSVEKPDAPVENRELIISSLTHDKEGDGMWAFEGRITNESPAGTSKVLGMFVYSQEDKLISLVMVH